MRWRSLAPSPRLRKSAASAVRLVSATGRYMSMAKSARQHTSRASSPIPPPEKAQVLEVQPRSEPHCPLSAPASTAPESRPMVLATPRPRLQSTTHGSSSCITEAGTEALAPETYSPCRLSATTSADAPASTAVAIFASKEHAPRSTKSANGRAGGLIGAQPDPPHASVSGAAGRSGVPEACLAGTVRLPTDTHAA